VADAATSGFDRVADQPVGDRALARVGGREWVDEHVAVEEINADSS
jgi:hypothetical protein